MAVNTQDFALDVSKQPTVMKVLRLAQGDHNGTTVRVAVTDAGAPLDLAGYDVYWAMLLPDGETFYRKDGTASGNVATVTIDERYAASVPGTTTVAYLEIRDGDELIASTERITVRISESAENGVTEARSWDSFVQKWLDGLQEVREAQESAYAEAEASREGRYADAEAARDALCGTAEEARDSRYEEAERARGSLFAQAESGRAEAESARAEAESARALAESGRASEESLRALAEDGRERAESSRAGAEQARAAAESVRARAESAREQAESSRALAEDAREGAEGARALAESARALAESDRAGAEAARAAAESGRESAEAGRAAAEGARELAEEGRALAESRRAAEFAEMRQLANGWTIYICGEGEYDAAARRPTVGAPEAGTLYMVPLESPTEDNHFEEWEWVGGSWERHGVTVLTVEAVTAARIDRMLGGEAVEGNDLLTATGLTYLLGAMESTDEGIDAILASLDE